MIYFVCEERGMETVFTYSYAKQLLDQSEYAYYTNYFINIYVTSHDLVEIWKSEALIWLWQEIMSSHLNYHYNIAGKFVCPRCTVKPRLSGLIGTSGEYGINEVQM